MVGRSGGQTKATRPFTESSSSSLACWGSSLIKTQITKQKRKKEKKDEVTKSSQSPRNLTEKLRFDLLSRNRDKNNNKKWTIKHEKEEEFRERERERQKRELEVKSLRRDFIIIIII